MLALLPLVALVATTVTAAPLATTTVTVTVKATACAPKSSTIPKSSASTSTVHSSVVSSIIKSSVVATVLSSSAVHVTSSSSAKVVSTSAKPTTSTAKVVSSSSAKVVSTSVAPITSTAKVTSSSSAKVVSTSAKPTTSTVKVVSSSSVKPSTSTSTSKVVSTTSKAITTSSTAPSASASVDADTALYLKLHNDFRKQYGANPLTWATDLATHAKSVSSTCVFAHSGAAGMGENLAAGVGGGYSITTAFNSWANEASSYNYSNPGFSEAAGHFTQVVWKNTTQVGCALVDCPNGSIFDAKYNGANVFVTCNYRAPGNIVGNNGQYFRDNVGTKV